MKKIKTLIEEIVLSELKILFEKDEMDLAAAADPTAAAPMADSTDEENVDETGGGLEDLADGDAPADDGSDPAAVDGEDATADDATDEMDDFGGGGAGGFGGGSSGGGGGFGSGSAFGDDSETETDSEDTDTESPSEDQNVMDDTGDPVQMVVNIAKDLRTKTGDSQQILNTVKAAIQEKFQNFDDASAIIQLLWETGEPVLQVVARKLILFIKGN